MGICYTQRRSAARVRTVVADVASQVAEMVDGDVVVGNIWDEAVEDTYSQHQNSLDYVQDTKTGEYAEDDDSYLKWVEKDALMAELAFQRDQADFMWAFNGEMA